MKCIAAVLLFAPCVAATASLRSNPSDKGLEHGKGHFGAAPTTCAAINDCTDVSFTACFGACSTTELGQIGGLDFEHGDISGSIDGSILSSFDFDTAPTGTDMLMLDWNQLSGSIPDEVCSISGATGLCIGENLLTGSIPDCIGDATDLTIISLWNNQLTGSIPGSICSLTNLKGLYLDGNDLTGSIPDCIGDLTNLEDLRLWDNQLGGFVPSSIGNLGKLKTFIVDANELVGTIPPEIGSLSSATYIALHDNKMSGELPASLGDLAPTMAGDGQFYVSNNKFTGTIPDSFCALGGAVRYCSTGNDLAFRDCSACDEAILTKCEMTCQPELPGGGYCAFDEKVQCDGQGGRPNANNPDCWEDYFCDEPELTCDKIDSGLGTDVCWTADADYDLVVIKAGSCTAGQPDYCHENIEYENVQKGDVVCSAELGPCKGQVTPGCFDERAVSHVIHCNKASAPAPVKPPRYQF